MFTAKWKKEAQHLVNGARKFVNYKRDVLKPERLADIEFRRQDLIEAIKTRELSKVNEASKQLRAVCDSALPHEKPLGWLEENVEVMFVAIVIALGLRAYYLQPFRIPTGSMQPTLNGIIATPKPVAEWPGLPQRLLEKVLRGRTYVHVVNDRDRQVAVTRDGQPDVKDVQYLHFFSRSQLSFRDSAPLRLPAPATPALQIGLRSALETAGRNRGVLPAGTVLCEGVVDSGDLVLVDKFSYHFRKPKRGEVFVFDTIGIDGIQKRGGEQGAGSHYIKRLCGVPGDTLMIQQPHLLVDGKIAKEPSIQKVMDGKGEYNINPDGYGLASPEPSHQGRRMPQYLFQADSKLSLASSGGVGMREYAALGDNTRNSLDSRYWGPVKEFNLVGPALFALWPFSTGHWGFIR